MIATMIFIPLSPHAATAGQCRNGVSQGDPARRLAGGLPPKGSEYASALLHSRCIARRLSGGPRRDFIRRNLPGFDASQVALETYGGCWRKVFALCRNP